MKVHRFQPYIVKHGRKAKRNKIKRIRVGARTPGSTGQGSIRRPY